MIISKINIDNCLYYHLHAEQTVTAAFTDGRNMGVLEQSVTDTTFNNIIDDYRNIKGKKPKTLVINFDFINAIQNNQISKISELRSLNTKLVLINIKKELVHELKLLNLFNNTENINDSEGDFSVFFCFESTKIELNYSTQDIFQQQFLNLLKDKKKNYIEDLKGTNQYHSSSSVYLDKWINIKKFISNDKEFFLYSVYHLAIKTYKKWIEPYNMSDGNAKPILVCQNLNSSYITSIISTLLKIDIVILDQIGPINKIYSTLDKKIEEGKKYIVVSDLICLGTEVKIAKNLIEFLGGEYLGNISIVRIQTIDPSHRSFKDSESVFIVDKENNKSIGYKISTNLDN